MTQGFGERLEPTKNFKNFNLEYFRGKKSPYYVLTRVN